MSSTVGEERMSRDRQVVGKLCAVSSGGSDLERAGTVVPRVAAHLSLQKAKVGHETQSEIPSSCAGLPGSSGKYS